MAVVPIGAEVRRLDVVDVGAGREPGIVFHRVWRGHHSPGILYRRARCKLIDVQDYGGGVCPVSLPLHHEVRRPRLFSKPAQSREGGGRCYRHRAVGGLGGKTLRLDEAPGLVESLGQRRTSPPEIQCVKGECEGKKISSRYQESGCTGSGPVTYSDRPAPHRPAAAPS